MDNRVMKRFLMVLVAAAMSVGPMAGRAAAQVEVNIVIPQRDVFVRPGRGPDRVHIGPVKMTKVDARVRITEQVAATTLRITLSNPAGRMQEAQLLVPVPEGAVVKSFVLEGLGEDGIAQLLPADEARRIYNGIVQQARDPGLLEFAGYNLIRSSVFPVPPNGEQSVSLTYEQVLPAESDRVDYVLPRSESLEQAGVAWSFSLDIESKRAISTVYSPSHDLVTERVSKTHVRVSVPAGSAQNDIGPLLVSYLLERPAGGVAATMLTYPDATVGGDGGDGQGGYFLLLAGLPADRPANVEPRKREVIVVIDRSGSMRGEKIAQAVESALQVIEGLNEGEAFNIIDYSNSVEMFAESPVLKSAKSIAEARTYLKAITANGGTALHDAMVEALRQDHHEGMLPMVLFLTDGLPTVGERNELAIRQAAKASNKHNRRVFTFGVGYDVNAPLLTTIAQQSRATSTFVLPEEDVEVKVGQVFKKLSGPVLSEPTLAVMGADGKVSTRLVREMMPHGLPDLFEGDQLVLLGQYVEDKPITMVLSGDYFGTERTFEFAFAMDRATTRNAFVPRLWASRKIAAMVDEIRAMGAGGSAVLSGGPAPTEDPRFKELVDEIITLSMKWGIMTEYTSFLAVEPGMRANAEALDLFLGVQLSGIGGGGDGETFAVAPSAALEDLGRESVSKSLDRRAVEERSGEGAVAQSLNAAQRGVQLKMNKGNRFYSEDMDLVTNTLVKQINADTFYNFGSGWIDAKVVESIKDKKEETKPDEIVEFDTDAFYVLLDTLVKQHRQAALAIGGDVYLSLNGKNVLVKLPTAGGEEK
jgi:Ca-activated chloride channel homolog